MNKLALMCAAHIQLRTIIQAYPRFRPGQVVKSIPDRPKRHYV